MAIFTVSNGSGIDSNGDGAGDGIQFGSVFAAVTSSGIAGFPVITPISGTVLFIDTGVLSLTGTGMSVIFPATFNGTLTGLAYSKPAFTPVFSITGFSEPLANIAAAVTGGATELGVLSDLFSGNDTIGGSALNDRLMGFAGDDTINAGEGNDMLRGGAGADVLNGGSGSDTANYQGSTAGVTVDLLNDTASGGDAQGDSLNDIENLYGSGNADVLTGDSNANIIGGEAGNDVLIGNGGDDAINGETGDDRVEGGAGNDRLGGAAGVDTIFGGDGNDTIDAGADNDTANGDAGDDRIYGGTGDDTLDGGDGNDTLEGAAGADRLVGGAGSDTAVYIGSAAGVSVNLGTGAASGGDAQGDTFSGIENLLGSNQADTLTGNDGANTLWGMAGDDVLVGGGGGDVLKGGAGNDRFVYTALSDSAVSGAGKDQIYDFSTGDRIDLSAIDADGNAGNGDTAFSFGTGAFTGHAGELRVVTSGTVQVVYVDTTGDKLPDLAINVYSDHALTAADFTL